MKKESPVQKGESRKPLARKSNKVRIDDQSVTLNLFVRRKNARIYIRDEY